MVGLSVAGDYRGAVAGTRSGCSVNGRFTDLIDFLVLHSPTTGEIRIDQYNANTGVRVCRMEGKARQLGKLLLVEDASYDCGASWSEKRARIYNLRRTPTGFEGQWFSDGGGGAPRAATSRASRTAEAPHALEQRHGGRGGGVERLHVARHRDRHHGTRRRDQRR